VPIEMSRCRARSRIPIKALRHPEATGHSIRAPRPTGAVIEVVASHLTKQATASIVVNVYGARRKTRASGRETSMELKAALVGCGAMSRAWLQAAARIPDLRIVGLADLDAERAKWRATEFSLKDPVVASDVHALIAESRPDLLFDVVVPSARHEVVSAGLAAGCHVLSEKPMAETLADACDLVARAKAAGCIHAVVQNRRYLAGVRRIARAVRSGAIGAITSVHADFFLAPHFGGFREEMDHVLLLDMAIHGFDALRCMTGLGASSVYCREWDPPQSWYRRGSSAAAIFELENGAVFVYRGSWCAQGLPTAWECAWRFVGAKGALTWDGSDEIRIEVLGSGERKGLFDPMTTVEPPLLAPGDRVDGHFGVLSDFVSAVRLGSEPETVGRDNIRSLAMVLGAIESSDAGRRVDIVI
jgi:predicted dehydrogenase